MTRQTFETAHISTGGYCLPILVLPKYVVHTQSQRLYHRLTVTRVGRRLVGAPTYYTSSNNGLGRTARGAVGRDPLACECIPQTSRDVRRPGTHWCRFDAAAKSKRVRTQVPGVRIDTHLTTNAVPQTTGSRHKKPFRPSPPVSRQRTSLTSTTTFRTTASLPASLRRPSSRRLPRQRTCLRGRQATRSTTSSPSSAIQASPRHQPHLRTGWVALASGEPLSHQPHRQLRLRHFRLSLHNNRCNLARTICWVCSEFVLRGY